MTDVPWSTIGELIEDARTRYADLEALVDGDVRLTYREYGEAIDSAARAHIAAGLGHGDRFTVWAPNIWQWPIAALGGHKIGSVLVPINTRFRGREAIDVLRRARSRVLFTVTDFLGTDFVAMLRDTGDQLPDLEQIVVLSGETCARHAPRQCNLTTCATSCSRRARPVHRRARCSSTRRSAACMTHGPMQSGCAPATASSWCSRICIPLGSTRGSLRASCAARSTSRTRCSTFRRC
jgi:acyl-CoA synthetase (AMP-forming)/AMP-acid ligase II